MAATDRRRLRVAILGGGAAGTLAAVHLLREPAAAPLEITLVDRAGSFGPGVAYATASPLHLLNVPAGRMGGISGQPDHFLRWLRGRGEEDEAGSFLSRGTYGAYLADLLDAAEAAAGGARLLRRRGEAVAVRRTPDAPSPLAVELGAGERLAADHVVLALGPLPGAPPFPVPPDLPPGAYVADPWAEGALAPPRRGESVLIVGSGLTMVDVALALAAAPAPPSIRAISRHGLLPRDHGPGLTRLDCFRAPPGAAGLDSLIAVFFAEMTRAAAIGGDWRDVVDSMRPAVPALWRRLGVADRRRFLSTLHRLWDVHRFRMAPAVAARVEELRREGQLEVGAGTVRSLARRGDRVEVVIEAGDGDETVALLIDRVINCSGAGTDVSGGAPPLLAALLADGLAAADPLGLGLEVDPDGAALDPSGRPSAPIHVVGALRLGVEWEAIGVTEIRDHAAAVARRIAAAGTGGAGPG
ncbi:MAG: FAD/NAD(P)-binding protein [Actinobacteria bacterium]|nr:FAD/NAD(P)-binding protein [Actinomycetota bacterium]